MKTRTYLAGALGMTSAVALIHTGQATAHETGPAVAPASTGPHISQGAMLSALVGPQLDRLEAWATSLEKRVAAVPDDSVLTGRSRAIATKQLAAARRANAFLTTITGLTAAQQARVDAVQAQLTAATTGLKALLANAPALPPRVKAVPTSAGTVKVADTRHHCDGDRLDGTRWDGSWNHHRRFRG